MTVVPRSSSQPSLSLQVRDVVLLFSEAAADRAENWQFHPKQVIKWLKDGWLEVRFRSGGWLEMAWHLYQWGDEVKVVAPEALRDPVHVEGRSDFEALPSICFHHVPRVKLNA